MKKQETTVNFDQNTASDYDGQREKLSPIKDALHLCTRMLFSNLSADANALIVGAGTGSELIYLAQTFPQWNFTVVEPAIKMLDICKKRADKYGISSRCFFHRGYLDSLPESRDFDLATSILVSHFFINPIDRGNYFSEISSRLRPGAYLVEASLASDMTKPEFKDMLEIWINMHDYAGMPVDTESFGKKVAMVPIEKVESILELNGFNKPTLFFKSLFINAWFSKVVISNRKSNKTL